jgi:hypothetical protein
MSKAAAHFGILLISAINALVVLGASLLGINGDGSVGVMPVVLGVGLAWVGAFATVSLQRARRGEGRAGVTLSASTLPYGLLVAMLGSFGWLFIKSLF